MGNPGIHYSACHSRQGCPFNEFKMEILRKIGLPCGGESTRDNVHLWFLHFHAI
jgi:hypothetical protein